MPAPIGVAAGRRREGYLADEMTPQPHLVRAQASRNPSLGVEVCRGQAHTRGPGRLRGGPPTRLGHLRGRGATRSVPCLAAKLLSLVTCGTDLGRTETSASVWVSYRPQGEVASGRFSAVLDPRPPLGSLEFLEPAQRLPVVRQPAQKCHGDPRGGAGGVPGPIPPRPEFRTGVAPAKPPLPGRWRWRR